jgi:hypothetical protein
MATNTGQSFTAQVAIIRYSLLIRQRQNYCERCADKEIQDEMRVSTNYLQVLGPISCLRCDYATDEKLPLNEQERRFRYHLETAHPHRHKDDLTREAIKKRPPFVRLEQ